MKHMKMPETDLELVQYACWSAGIWWRMITEALQSEGAARRLRSYEEVWKYARENA